VIVVMHVVVGPAGNVLHGHFVNEDQPIRSFVGLDDVPAALQDMVARCGAAAPESALGPATHDHSPRTDPRG
jgi:hypothetical protein